MGAVRMRVQTADKNITIISRLHCLECAWRQGCILFWNIIAQLEKKNSPISFYKPFTNYDVKVKRQIHFMFLRALLKTESVKNKASTIVL